jgi:hypothetical protein
VVDARKAPQQGNNIEVTDYEQVGPGLLKLIPAAAAVLMSIVAIPSTTASFPAVSLIDRVP